MTPATMTFDFDPIYLIYVLVAGLGRLVRPRASICLCFTGATYRNNVNRRLEASEGPA